MMELKRCRLVLCLFIHMRRQCASYLSTSPWVQGMSPPTHAALADCAGMVPVGQRPPRALSGSVAHVQTQMPKTWHAEQVAEDCHSRGRKSAGPMTSSPWSGQCGGWSYSAQDTHTPCVRSCLGVKHQDEGGQLMEVAKKVNRIGQHTSRTDV